MSTMESGSWAVGGIERTGTVKLICCTTLRESIWISSSDKEANAAVSQACGAVTLAIGSIFDMYCKKYCEAELEETEILAKPSIIAKARPYTAVVTMIYIVV